MRRMTRGVVAPRTRCLEVVGFAAVVGLFFVAEWGLGSYYYGRSYSHYLVGQVYWEDSNTELFFSPDRYLFWRYKPDIRMELATAVEEYGLYRVGTETVPHRIVVETDERGFRGPGFECEKPPGVYRIFAVGDSRTMAEGVSESERYSDVLEALLNARQDGRTYEVINAATDGYSSYQGRVLLERELLACEPDAVTVLFGTNDQDWDQNVRDVDKAKTFDSIRLDFSQWANESMLVYFARRQLRQLKAFLFGGTPGRPTYESPSEGQQRRVPLDDYEANLEAIIEMGEDRDFIPLFIVVPGSPYARYPELFIDSPKEVPGKDLALWKQAHRDWEAENFAAGAGLLEWFVQRHPDLSAARFHLAQFYQKLGRFEDAHREFVRAGKQINFVQYDDKVREVATREGALVADLSPEFLRLREEPLFIDDGHPNPLGHRLIAEEVYRQLAPRLDANEVRGSDRTSGGGAEGS